MVLLHIVGINGALMNAHQLHQTITELIRAACTEGHLEWSVLAEWERQWENCQQKLPLLEAKVQELQAALKKSLEPPLQYSIFLKPAPGAERDVVVGSGSGRMEVHLADHGLVPDAQGQGEPHTLAREFDHLIHQDPSTLAYHGHVTGGGTNQTLRREEEGVYVSRRVDTQAIGTD